jgi:hypothetical protein
VFLLDGSEPTPGGSRAHRNPPHLKFAVGEVVRVNYLGNGLAASGGSGVSNWAVLALIRAVAAVFAAIALAVSAARMLAPV